MSAGNNLPQNFLIPSRYQLSFSRVSNTVFYCSTVTIPQIDLTHNEQPTPFGNLPVPGDRIIWSPLRVRFLVDAKLSAWWDIFNWMIGLGRPENAQQYADLAANSVVNGAFTYGTRPPYADASVIQYTSRNNPLNKFTYVDCWPASLDSINFDYKQNADDVLECGASFYYSYYQFESY